MMKVQDYLAIDHPRVGVGRSSRRIGREAPALLYASNSPVDAGPDTTVHGKALRGTQFFTAADCIRASMVLPQSRLNAKLKSPRPAITFRWSRTTSS
jgi:hypothetical protein